mmetsp:Transcript_79052/g.243959  ORF Transcript_79052/g.243959 Transcript_79052/m.243959 type:complete len:216 (-) Transcript_79052:22-669(-)
MPNEEALLGVNNGLQGCPEAILRHCLERVPEFFVRPPVQHHDQFREEVLREEPLLLHRQGLQEDPKLHCLLSRLLQSIPGVLWGLLLLVQLSILIRLLRDVDQLLGSAQDTGEILPLLQDLPRNLLPRCDIQLQERLHTLSHAPWVYEGAALEHGIQEARLPEQRHHALHKVLHGLAHFVRKLLLLQDAVQVDRIHAPVLVSRERLQEAVQVHRT